MNTTVLILFAIAFIAVVAARVIINNYGGFGIFRRNSKAFARINFLSQKEEIA